MAGLARRRALPEALGRPGSQRPGESTGRGQGRTRGWPHHGLSAVLILAVSCFCLLLAGCRPPAQVGPPREFSAWLVYWAGDSGLSELAAHGRLFRQVSLFAYELDESGHPRPAPGLAAVLPQFLALAQSQGFAPWITVVNDIRSENGTISLKNTKLLTPIIQDPERRREHGRRLADLVKKDGFAGLILDYEGFGPSQSQAYQALVAELAREMHILNLGLRVVVEPRRGPLPAPKEVRLIVMGYNLHGPQSGPGPRSTPSFIAGLGSRGEGDVAGGPAIALAVGGFLWPAGGKTQKVSWNAAFQAAQKAEVQGRSSPDGSPFARFSDSSQLWFEDPQSLQAKWVAAREAGFASLWLWHLGDNDERLYHWLSQLRLTPAGN